MFRNLAIMTAVTLASLGAIASAEVISIQPGQFAVFAGQSLGIGSGAAVHGDLASFSSGIDLGSGVTIYGSMFAGDDIRVSLNSVVHGNAISGGYTTLGAGVTIGRIDAGAKSSGHDNEITVGDNSVVGGMYSSRGVSLGAGVQVSGDISASHDVTAGKDLNLSGSILTGRKVTVKKGGVLSGNIHAGDDIKLHEDSVVSGNIYGADKVTLGKRSTAGELHGRDVTVDDDAAPGSMFASRDAKVEDRAVINGSINAGDDVELKTSARVNGDVTYADDLKQDKSATVTGTAAQGTPVAPTAPSVPNVDGPRDWSGSPRDVPTFVSGGTNVSIARNGNTTLSAGNYRNLSVGRDATLTLTAGAYNFADIRLDKGVRVTADTTGGNVLINSAEDFNMDSGGIIARLGNGEVIISSADDLNVGRNAQIAAQLRAYDDLSAGASATINGRVYANEEVWLSEGVQVYSSSLAGVPEPGTLVLLGIGSLLVIRRRRNNARRAV